jgi:LPXTG-motif cell wall-anchored protein
MPKTGDNSKNPYPFAAAGILAMAGAFVLGRRYKREIKNDIDTDRQ